MMKVVVFGAGRFFDNRKWSFQEFEIVAFLDNNKKLQGTQKETLKGDVPIIAPEKILELEYDAVVIMSLSVGEMREQLLSYSIPEEKIYRFAELKLMRTQQNFQVYYGNDFVMEGETGKKVLLLTHELSLSGGPVVVLQYARMLKKNGYHPIIASLEDGKLREDILREKTPLVICDNLSKYNTLMWNWMNSFDLIIANTVAFYYLAEQTYGTDMKIIWWLHDIFEKSAIVDWFPIDKISDNISIYTGGRFVKEKFWENYGFENMEVMLYGVPDRCPQNYMPCLKEDGKVVFAIVASVEPRKGQDVLADAILALSPEVRAQAEFFIIGKARNDYLQKFADEVAAKLEGVEEVKFLGEVDSDALFELYENQIDVVVCPSRNDPMPVVVTNGFMFQKACIVSDYTGQADFIEEKQNGFVFQNENAQELAEKMQWIINNKTALPEIGAKARKLYDDIFSMEKFEEQAISAVNKKLRG